MAMKTQMKNFYDCNTLSVIVGKEPCDGDHGQTLIILSDNTGTLNFGTLKLEFEGASERKTMADACRFIADTLEGK